VPQPKIQGLQSSLRRCGHADHHRGLGLRRRQLLLHRSGSMIHQGLGYDREAVHFPMMPIVGEDVVKLPDYGKPFL
jgi:hypothetical protein